MRMATWMTAAILLTACNGEGKIKDKPNELEDPWDYVTYQGICETFTDSEGIVHDYIPGAETSFVGDYYFYETDDPEKFDLEGTLTWHFYTNVNWRNLAGLGDTCTITWRAVGQRVDAELCEYCDFGISMNLILSDSETDCPAGLYEGYESAEDGYEVSIAQDGTASFFFVSDGVTHWADGQANGARAWFVEEPKCRWF